MSSRGKLRIGAIAILSLAVSATITTTILSISYAQLAKTAWPMFHHDLAHTGLSGVNTSTNNGGLKWAFLTGSPVTSSPAISADGNTIYVGSDDGNLYAICATHNAHCSGGPGTLKWAFMTASSALGNQVDSSPAIGADGTIYFGARDHSLYALTDKGTHPALKAGWPFSTDGEVASSPAIGGDGTIYITNEQGHLYAVNPNGKAKWKTPFLTPNAADFSSPALFGNPQCTAVGVPFMCCTGTRKGSCGASSIIYFGSNDDKVYAVTDNGTAGALKSGWPFVTSNEVFSSPAIGSDGTIYILSTDNFLYAINSNGTQHWKFAAGTVVLVNPDSSPAISADGKTIYIGGIDGNLYAVCTTSNPNCSGGPGTLKWKFPTGGPLISSPAISSEGTIYVGSRDGKLWAITDNGTSGLLNRGGRFRPLPALSWIPRRRSVPTLPSTSGRATTSTR